MASFDVCTKGDQSAFRPGGATNTAMFASRAYRKEKATWFKHICSSREHLRQPTSLLIAHRAGFRNSGVPYWGPSYLGFLLFRVPNCRNSHMNSLDTQAPEAQVGIALNPKP